MFARLLFESFRRQRRRKAFALLAIALGMSISTAMISLATDIGDKMNQELRTQNANLLITSAAESLDVNIGGVSLKPASQGSFLRESDLPKMKQTFWGHNILGFAPFLSAPQAFKLENGLTADLIGTYFAREIHSEGETFVTGVRTINKFWQVQGEWPADNSDDVLVGSSLARKAGLHIGDTIGDSSVTAALVPHSSLPNSSLPTPARAKAARAGDPGRDERLSLPHHPQDQKARVLGAPAGPRFASESLDADTASGSFSLKMTHYPKVTGILTTGGPEDEAIVAPLAMVQAILGRPDQVQRAVVSALTKPEDAFARRDPRSMSPAMYERWSCTPYANSIAEQIQAALPNSRVEQIRQVEQNQGRVLSRISGLMLLLTIAALVASALAVSAVMAATIIERRQEVGLMKSLGAGNGLVASLFLTEAGVLALAGGILGFLAGAVVAHRIGQSIFGSSITVHPVVLAVVIFTALIVTFAGSTGAVRKAMSFDPALVLRGDA